MPAGTPAGGILAFTQVTDLLQRTAGYHGRARRAFARCGRRGGASAHLAQFLAGEEEDMMRELRALEPRATTGARGVRSRVAAAAAGPRRIWPNFSRAKRRT
ncbi:MAG: hypothetical protein AUJ52_14280 [Elusimicrobia bacterium CG1_02_63_36]|nr:MAG: hypothetical protein AUJ52_14280 [Elusimicrobia bacterium CG1_02_63_36]